ncbi:MAG: putative isomerase [Pseudonocardiales bacterium]|nr:putative isomerase [Pseudonocardiales bacterium]
MNLDATTAAAIAEEYIAAWNETDATLRAAAVGRLFAADARYIDPMMDVVGAAPLAEAIGAVHAKFPGWSFRLAGPVDGHHQQVRFSWELGPVDAPAGAAPVAGFDVAQVAEGRVTSVLGFLDRVPAA